MITVEVFLDEKEFIQGFRVEGHSDFAPHGEDIVCSAVSALTQTAVLGLTKYLHLTPEVSIKPGDMECFLPKQLAGEPFKLAQAILKTLVLGLMAIEESYGEYVVVQKRRWR